MAAPEGATAEVEAVLADPSVSSAFKAVLREWVGRDPVDAARDADLLAAVLARRCDQMLGRLA